MENANISDSISTTQNQGCEQNDTQNTDKPPSSKLARVSSTEYLEQLAKDKLQKQIDNCPTCSPTKTKPSPELRAKLHGEGDAPSHIKDGYLLNKPGAKQSLDGLFLMDQKDGSRLQDGSRRGSNTLAPLDESSSRNMSFASLETNQISMIPQTAGSHRSEDLLSEEWDQADNNEVREPCP